MERANEVVMAVKIPMICVYVEMSFCLSDSRSVTALIRALQGISKAVLSIPYKI